MPVVTVTAAPLASPDEERGALGELAAAIAAALGLPADGVHVTLVHAVAAVLGTDPDPGWPVVLLHGGRRPPDRMRAAAVAAREVAARRWGRGPDAVWVQWLVADEGDLPG